MTPTQEIEMWIVKHGNARNALNVALVRLQSARAEGFRAGAEAMKKNTLHAMIGVAEISGNTYEMIRALPLPEPTP
jgi:hypothetical protein